jgi:hypothetical protein
LKWESNSPLKHGVQKTPPLQPAFDSLYFFHFHFFFPLAFNGGSPTGGIPLSMTIGPLPTGSPLSRLSNPFLPDASQTTRSSDYSDFADYSDFNTFQGIQVPYHFDQIGDLPVAPTLSGACKCVLFVCVCSYRH